MSLQEETAPANVIKQKRQGRRFFHFFFISVGMILTLLATAGFFAFDQLHKQDQARDWVLHTYHVIDELHHTRAAVKDGELAERGYFLTFEDEYLKSLNESAQKAKQLLNRVRELTKDNPEQQQEVGFLTYAIDKKFVQLKEEVASIKAGKTEREQLAQQMDLSKKSLDDIRNSILRMINREHQLLDIRVKTLNLEADRTQIDLELLIFMEKTQSTEQMDQGHLPE